MQGILFSNFFLIGSTLIQKSIKAKLLPTVKQAEGPYYPIKKPIDQDADLTLIGAQKERAQGDVYIIQGRVLNIDGQPLSNALVEIWQANKWGRYQDRRDASDLPWDHNFQGYGKARTDDAGYYAFRTIKPAGYGQGSFRRTPHIHFKVNKQGFDELVTQMYFADELQNKKDVFYNNAARTGSISVQFESVERGWLVGNFNLILE